MSSDFAIFGRNVPEEICTTIVLLAFKKIVKFLSVKNQLKSWSVTNSTLL